MGGNTPKSFYKASITLMPKPYMDTARKENYNSVSLNINASILNKILANSYSRECKDGSHQ